MLRFWLLFYLSEGLIFILPNNLAFVRANAGVGGPRGGKNPSLFVGIFGKFVANPVLILAGEFPNKSGIASRECMSYLETFHSLAFKIQQQTKNGCRKNTATH